MPIKDFFRWGRKGTTQQAPVDQSKLPKARDLQLDRFNGYIMPEIQSYMRHMFMDTPQPTSLLAPSEEGGNYTLVAFNPAWKKLKLEEEVRPGSLLKSQDEIALQKKAEALEKGSSEYEREKGGKHIKVKLKRVNYGNNTYLLRVTEDVTAEVERQEADAKRLEAETRTREAEAIAASAKEDKERLRILMGDTWGNLAAGAYGAVREARENLADRDPEMAQDMLQIANKPLHTMVISNHTYQYYSNLSEGGIETKPVSVTPILSKLLDKEFKPYWDVEEDPIGTPTEEPTKKEDAKPPIMMPKKLTIEYTTPEGSIPLDKLPKVQGTQELVEATLNETIINAVESDSKAVTVTISARQEEENLMLTVSDNGRGLDEKHLRRAQRAFHKQLGAKLSSRLGLGGFVARKATEAMGGSIQLESTPGEGTTATITLPLAK